MIFIQSIAALLIVLGALFFIAGIVGLLRFPDVYTRLHALTKADNLGLGLVVAGLVLQADAWTEVFRLGAIWLLALSTSATVAHLVARAALREGLEPWRRR